MSWVEKELKKRAAVATRPPPQEPPPAADAPVGDPLGELWARFVAANDALPAELRLRAATTPPPAMGAGGKSATAWLHAANGAALGRTPDGIRYVWPKPGKERSNNFWIRWKGPHGLLLQQRAGKSAVGPTFVERRFDPKRVEHIVKCLVIGRHVKLRAVRRKRLGLF